MNKLFFVVIAAILLSSTVFAQSQQGTTNFLSGLFNSISSFVGGVVNALPKPQGIFKPVEQQPTYFSVSVPTSNCYTDTYGGSCANMPADHSAEIKELDKILDSYNNVFILQQYQKQATDAVGENYHLHFLVTDDQGKVFYTGGFLKTRNIISTHKHAPNSTIPSVNATVTIPYSTAHEFLTKPRIEQTDFIKVFELLVTGKIKVDPASEAFKFQTLLGAVSKSTGA